MFLEVLPRDTPDEAVEFNVDHWACCYFPAEPNSVAYTWKWLPVPTCHSSHNGNPIKSKKTQHKETDNRRDNQT